VFSYETIKTVGITDLPAPRPESGTTISLLMSTLIR